MSLNTNASGNRKEQGNLGIRGPRNWNMNDINIEEGKRNRSFKQSAPVYENARKGVGVYMTVNLYRESKRGRLMEREVKIS